MEDVLWYVLASSRGGPTRARILRLLEERPRNANQIAETLDYDYTTVRHHLDVLTDNGVVTTVGEGYGVVYVPTDRCRTHWDVVEEIIDELD
ncbi:MAG: winged helix-turn-helix domain-containing protein [Halobacteriaceae archaeon]